MNQKEQIEYLLSQQSYTVPVRSDEDRKEAQKIIMELGVREGSQFYELYSKYFMESLDHRGGTSSIIDPLPDGFSYEYFQFAWGLPDNYILFTTGEGEGGYLYETQEEKVWDFNLGEREQLLAGTLPHWNSFYDFMLWYLQSDKDVDDD
ncbi:hypothetical protein [Suttonella ornithocola]|uniref:SMI1 / KNR4 family n=1 Tax=Suttonella ornithocola TaxID=279832 RepID=A0A380MUU1_9GAMM|nr:hypothetical protein [Suttonella ornithocola]SUO96068.1 Uncharacterised protein [Suttonella ornithocola]